MVKPGRERSLAIVGDPALMQRQKRILDQIVRILRVRRQPSLEIALQQMPQNTEQTAIGILVPSRDRSINAFSSNSLIAIMSSSFIRPYGETVTQHRW